MMVLRLCSYVACIVTIGVGLQSAWPTGSLIRQAHAYMHETVPVFPTCRTRERSPSRMLEEVLSRFSAVDSAVSKTLIIFPKLFTPHTCTHSPFTTHTSHLPASISWRDMWALVTVKGGEPLAEDVGKSADIQSWGPSVMVQVTVPIQDSVVECDWPATVENTRRRKFCSKYEGYGALCHCAKPLPLTIKSPSLAVNNVANVPVCVIASNRPLYLFR